MKLQTIDVDGVTFRFTQDRSDFMTSLIQKFPGQTIFTRKELKQVQSPVPYWLNNSDRYPFKKKTNSGVEFDLTSLVMNFNIETSNVVPLKPDTTTVVAKENMIPELMPNYVPFGHYNDVRDIIKSKMFFPVFITGLSGNGKTLMVEQICAKLKRELYRVNITIETDEDDLMGGHTLVDGNIVYREGPVLSAMRNGAVLLLDEVDLGSNKLLCMQSVLEGKGYFIKKTGEMVRPQPGFQIVATANTKGRGSEDGKFIGTQIMNEAMLERFAITLAQEYPKAVHERKILSKQFSLLDKKDDEFVKKLVDWANIIRDTYYEGGIDDVVTTRRLVHIVNAFNVFGDKYKSIEMCVARFDDETKDSILDLYTKIDSGVIAPETGETNDEITRVDCI